MELLTKEEQKTLALIRLKQMDIYKPYIKAFEEKGVITFFERFGGYYATADNGEKELEDYICAYEERTGDMVYAATHEIFEFGECYSLLIVSKYREDEVDDKLEANGTKFFPYAYVWNKSVPDFSEYGTICVQAFGGGLTRVQ